MITTRREALLAAAAGAAALHTGILHAAETQPVSETPDSAPAMTPLDYGLSFICNTAPANAVRFWVESRTRLIDDATGAWTDYYQCASCKSEHTFAEKDLFSQDNYDFLPILGDGRYLIFRRPARLNDQYRTVKTVERSGASPAPTARSGRCIRAGYLGNRSATRPPRPSPSCRRPRYGTKKPVFAPSSSVRRRP